MPSYFTRGSGHNAKAQYSEREDDYINNMDRLAKKFDTMRSKVPAPMVDVHAGAKVGIIAIGTSDYAVQESRDQMRAEQKLETSYLRLRAYPFNQQLDEFIKGHDRVYVIDQNRDVATR